MNFRKSCPHFIPAKRCSYCCWGGSAANCCHLRSAKQQKGKDVFTWCLLKIDRQCLVRLNEGSRGKEKKEHILYRASSLCMLIYGWPEAPCSRHRCHFDTQTCREWIGKGCTVEQPRWLTEQLTCTTRYKYTSVRETPERETKSQCKVICIRSRWITRSLRLGWDTSFLGIDKETRQVESLSFVLATFFFLSLTAFGLLFLSLVSSGLSWQRAKSKPTNVALSVSRCYKVSDVLGSIHSIQLVKRMKAEKRCQVERCIEDHLAVS